MGPYIVIAGSFAYKWSFIAVATSLSLVTLSACSVFGVESVEEAAFQVVTQSGQYEIRDYAPLVAVETRVDGSYSSAGNQAFRKLFRYISGDNESSSRIAMTAPVISEQAGDPSGEKIEMTAPVLFEKDGDSWLYQFVLPASYTLESAPKPLDSDVVLVTVPKQRVATRTYSGRGTAKASAKNAELLTQWIRSQGLVATSEPRWAGYNAPWTLPPFRRNEVLISIEVEASGSDSSAAN